MTLLRFVIVPGLVIIAALTSSMIGWYIAPICFGHADAQLVLQIQPSHLELVSPVEEGTDVQLPLMMNNTADFAVTVRKVGLTCRCTNIAGRGNKPLEEPFEVGPKATIPLQMTINTQSAEGDLPVSIIVQYEVDGVVQSAQSDIIVHVLPGLRCIASPGVIRDPGNESAITGSFLLGDSLSGSGIQIESVSSSFPNLVKTELEHVPDDLVFSASADSPEYQRRFRKRCKVVFSFNSQATAFNESIIVTPENKSIKPLHIPLVYEGWQGQPKIYPPEVLISRGVDGQVLHREIHFVSGKTRPFKAISILSAPEWIQTKIVPEANNEWTVQLTLSPSQENDTDTIISLGNEDRQPVVEIPVRFIGTLEHGTVQKFNGT